MILWVLSFFSHKIYPVFFYYSTRMLLAALTSLVFILILTPVFVRFLKNRSMHQMLRKKEEVGHLADLHQKKEGTPTMGGVLVLFSMLISLFLWMDLSHVFTWILLISTLWLGMIGFIDDFLKFQRKNSGGLKGKRKLYLQFALALVISCYFLIPSFNYFLEKKFSLRPPVVKEQIIHKKGKEPDKDSFQFSHLLHFQLYLLSLKDLQHSFL